MRAKSSASASCALLTLWVYVGVCAGKFFDMLPHWYAVDAPVLQAWKCDVRQDLWEMTCTQRPSCGTNMQRLGPLG